MNEKSCVLHVDITLEVFLNEIWTSVYFTDDNWRKGVSAIQIHGILYFSYTEILIKILLHKYVTVCISHYTTLGRIIPTWNMKSLLFTYINKWTGFHTWHKIFFKFRIRKSRPRYSYKKYWTLYFIYENMVANFPRWNGNSLYITFEIWPSIYHKIWNIWKSLLIVSSRKYWTLCMSHMKTWVLIYPCAIRNYVYFGYQNLCTDFTT